MKTNEDEDEEMLSIAEKISTRIFYNRCRSKTDRFICRSVVKQRNLFVIILSRRKNLFDVTNLPSLPLVNAQCTFIRCQTRATERHDEFHIFRRGKNHERRLIERIRRAFRLIDDELHQLGRDFDQMTARLRAVLEQQTRLMHDVSHELRPHLTRVQVALGFIQQQPKRTLTYVNR